MAMIYLFDLSLDIRSLKVFCEKSFDLFVCEFGKFHISKIFLKMVPVFYALIFARKRSVFSSV